MSRYGIDYYGLGTYTSGTTAVAPNSVGTFTAKPFNYGAIKLKWGTPSASAGTYISKLVLVRNQYGFPVSPYDGTQVLVSIDGSNPTEYIDTTGLSDGGYFYYSIFIYVYTSSSNSYAWVNAGTAYGLAVTKAGYTDRLYNSIPEIYKIFNTSSPSSDWDNPDLYNFLANFGFQLDYMQNITDLLRRRYNIETVNGNLIPTLMNQFGFSYEGSLGLQQNRILLRDAVLLNKQKGTKQGITAFLKDFTGYAVPSVSTAPNPNVTGVTIGHNLMLDYNDSSFEESVGHWVSDGTARVGWMGTLNVKSVSLTTNVATLVVGPHQYEVGHYIAVTGLPAPLFNTASVQITAVDQSNTISFALTYSNVASTSGYNVSTGAYGKVSPRPIPWVESTAPTLFPNKKNGVLSLINLSTTAQNINAYCGLSDPVGQGVPVTGSSTYTFSAYMAVQNGASAKTIVLSIRWYDRFGKYISTSTGTGASDSSTVFATAFRPSVSAAAPSTAFYAVPGITVNSAGGSALNEHHHFDAAQFELAAAKTEFDEARQMHIVLKANRINELINPHFASPITPWSLTNATSTVINTIAEPTATKYTVSSTSILGGVASVILTTYHQFIIGETVYLTGITGSGVTSANYNGARVITNVSSTGFTFSTGGADQSSIVTTGNVYDAGNTLKVTASSGSVTVTSWDGSTTSQLMPIYYPQTSYTFSIYTQALVNAENVTVNIKWYNSSYTLISTSTGTTINMPLNGKWYRPYVTATAPATAAYAATQVVWPTVSGNTLALDAALFENTGLVLTYFDGSYGEGLIPYDFIWEGGTANAGRSHYYKNRYSAQIRLLVDALTNQLNLGSTAAFYLAQPKT